MDAGKGDCLPHPEAAEHINAWRQYSLETNYIGSSPSVTISFFLFQNILYSQTLRLCSNTSII